MVTKDGNKLLNLWRNMCLTLPNHASSFLEWSVCSWAVSPCANANLVSLFSCKINYCFPFICVPVNSSIHFPPLNYNFKPSTTQLYSPIWAYNPIWERKFFLIKEKVSLNWNAQRKRPLQEQDLFMECHKHTILNTILWHSVWTAPYLYSLISQLQYRVNNIDLPCIIPIWIVRWCLTNQTS